MDCKTYESLAGVFFVFFSPLGTRYEVGRGLPLYILERVALQIHVRAGLIFKDFVCL